MFAVIAAVVMFLFVVPAVILWVGQMILLSTDSARRPALKLLARKPPPLTLVEGTPSPRDAQMPTDRAA